jgi:hypothetical protein
LRRTAIYLLRGSDRKAEVGGDRSRQRAESETMNGSTHKGGHSKKKKKRKEIDETRKLGVLLRSFVVGNKKNKTD